MQSFAVNSDKTAFIITGMHRSGTSLTAAILQSAGVDVGERLLGANESNAKGHFENIDFFEFHKTVLRSQGIDDAGWTLTETVEVEQQYIDQAKELIAINSKSPYWGWKDPRTTLFLNFWADLLPEAKFILVYRSPWEVVDSLYRRGGENDTIFFSHPDLAVKLWIHYNQKILNFYDRFPDRCILTSVYSIANQLEKNIEAINHKFQVTLANPAPDIFERSLLRVQEANVHRATLVAYYFPEALNIYQELNAKAIQIDQEHQLETIQKVRNSPYKVWAFQDWVDLCKSEKQGKRLQSELERRSHAQLLQTQAELGQSQTQLAQTQAELERSQVQTQAELGQTQAQLAQTQAELERSQAQLAQTQAELGQTHAQLAQTQAQLAQTQVERQQAEATIAAMHTSKFWKLRTAWFTLKKRMGVATHK
ncbi:sulfotransferase [Gloeocapsopsis crepidinum LEGE 06123]|uniref:Sulfotransferase n=1 Tax=Gloeocapsopsis crepidinum LEGE 06123 TaxID=588587 RepID=A0ABR9UU01_9CHRO|nr:sulfotransferase [Gloeocapsopsis crepidinum]MBE9191778.1 sulfotransferase [Gloeocapsopsis crepidinum LEGE 06123]